MQNEELKKMAGKLTEEQFAKAAAAKTPEEILALAQEEGVTLTDAQLEEISGGSDWDHAVAEIYCCPECGGDLNYLRTNSKGRVFTCWECGWANREDAY